MVIPMELSEFITLAEKTLQQLSDTLEEADPEGALDIDFNNGILTIELPDGGQYVINRHNASGQIWLSSPKSGASHFSYQEREWVDSKGNRLKALLQKELHLQ